MKISKIKLFAGLLACQMLFVPMTAMNAAALNLHDESTMTEEEKKIKEYCDIAVNIVNNERVAYGLSELKTLPELHEVTCIRAEELTKSFTHYRPDGSICFTAAKEAGLRYSLIAENIAAGRSDPVDTVAQWMSSEGHRKNILGEKYTHVGIGYYYRPTTEDIPDGEYNYEYYWSMFLIGSYDGGDPFVFDTQYQPTRGLGDADGSHKVSATDAALIMRYSASLAAGISYPVTHDFADAADVNGDGNIDAIDASIILAYNAEVGAGNTGAQLSDYIW